MSNDKSDNKVHLGFDDNSVRDGFETKAYRIARQGGSTQKDAAAKVECKKRHFAKMVVRGSDNNKGQQK